MIHSLTRFYLGLDLLTTFIHGISQHRHNTDYFMLHVKRVQFMNFLSFRNLLVYDVCDYNTQGLIPEPLILKTRQGSRLNWTQMMQLNH